MKRLPVDFGAESSNEIAPRNDKLSKTYSLILLSRSGVRTPEHHTAIYPYT